MKNKEEFNLRKKIRELNCKIFVIYIWIFIITIILFCLFYRISEPLSKESNCNITINQNLSELNLDNIGYFCQTKELKGYNLNVWWDGCSSRGGEIKFTCGFVNKDGASKYNCYTITELKKWLDEKL